MSAVLTPPMPASTVTPPPVSQLPAATVQSASASEPLGDLPLQAHLAGLRRISVEEYHAMIQHGILKSGERVELLEGYLVNQMPKNRPHSIALNRLRHLLDALLPVTLTSDIQGATTLDTSEPEPDYYIFRGKSEDFPLLYPGPGDIVLVVEVSDSSLRSDRKDKTRIYAAAGFPLYWIVNIPERIIEVYTHPQTSSPPASYATRTDYTVSESVPLVLDGVVHSIAVADILPPQ